MLAVVEHQRPAHRREAEALTRVTIATRLGLACVATAAIAATAACRSQEPPRAEPAGSSSPSAAPVADDPWAAREQRPLPPPDVTDPFPRPLFWTATRDGSTTYLFGTLHGGVAAERRIPRWVWRHFDEATTLMLETNLQDVELGNWTIRPVGPSLREELGEAYWQKLEALVPPLLASVLDKQATAVAAMRVFGGYGVDEAPPMDGALLVRAQGQKKQLVFLETAAFQGSLFAQLYDVATLKRVLDRRAEVTALNAPFMHAYVGGDDAQLAELARAQFRLAVADDAALAAFLDTLLIARNRAWIPAIEQAHAAGPTFVAVGALHLVGEHSVLELLRARGFAIARPTAP